MKGFATPAVGTGAADLNCSVCCLLGKLLKALTIKGR